MTWSNISPQVFELDPGIRYLAVNQGGEIVEMAQRLPSHNPVETDRIESGSDAVAVVTKILEYLENPVESPEVQQRPSRLAGVRTKQHLGAI